MELAADRMADPLGRVKEGALATGQPASTTACSPEAACPARSSADRPRPASMPTPRSTHFAAPAADEGLLKIPAHPVFSAAACRFSDKAR